MYLDFNGTLLYVKKNGAFVPFPNHYILLDTVDTDPDKRLEIKAIRNIFKLNRITAPNVKTVLSFQTHILHLDEMAWIRTFFNSAFKTPLQRRLEIKYWNVEKMEYKTGIVYMPDIKYRIRDVIGTDIIFGPATFEFIEY